MPNLVPVNSQEFRAIAGVPTPDVSMSREPAKMSITNLYTNLSQDAQFNPVEFTEALRVNYTKLGLLGRSYRPLQYQNTDNHGIKFELGLRVFKRGENQKLRIYQFRNFLLSLCYPRRGAADVVGGAPPRVLLVWPQMVSLTCRIMSVEGTHSFFGSSGGSNYPRYKVEIENVSDAQIYMEDLLENGTQRSGAAPTSTSTDPGPGF
jgi:hypothetical protein